MNKCYLHGLLLASLGCFVGHHAYAQEGVESKDTLRNGAITFMRLAPSGAARKEASQATAALRSLLKLQPADELRAQKSTSDALGFTHTTHAQYYHSVPVEYGIYVVHARKGFIETINGEVVRVRNLDSNPSLPEKEALSKALASTNAKLYNWQVPAKEQWLKLFKNDSKATFYPKGELLISQDEKVAEGARLAYKFTIYAQEPASAMYVYVDAHTGEVFRKQSVNNDVNSPATAATSYSGSQSITTDFTNGVYRLREVARGSGAACGTGSASIETYNANGSDITNSSTNWANESSLDAHWAAEKTYDYFRTTFCRNSYDGTGGTLKLYTHNGLADNAFWSNDPNILAAFFFDGNTQLNAVTSLDAVAHELAHGYTLKMVGLNGDPEPNALNEGISDIWAACVERTVAPNKQTYLIGEDVMKSGFACLRNLSNPNTGVDPFFCTDQNTHQIIGYPEVYGGPHYDTRQTPDPHINGLIISHCFFLLAEGGSGTNNAGTSFSVSGIGITKAAQILFRAEDARYLTPTSSFAMARTAMVSAASDLFGACSPEAVAVKNAWFAVGVGQQAPANGLPNVSATYYCSSCYPSSTTSMQDFNYLSSPGTYIVSLQPTNYLEGPNVTSWTWSNVISTGSYYTQGTKNEQGIFTLASGGRAQFTVTGTIPTCGTISRTLSLYVTGTRSYAVAPNPSTSDFTVSASDSPTSTPALTSAAMPQTAPQESSFEARLYNSYGTLVSMQKSQHGKVRFSTSDLPNGLYTLRIGTGKDALSEHIQVSH